MYLKTEHADFDNTEDNGRMIAKQEEAQPNAGKVQYQLCSSLRFQVHSHVHHYGRERYADTIGSRSHCSRTTMKFTS